MTKKSANGTTLFDEKVFRLISENVSDLIAVLDLQGKRLYNSPSYDPILGDPEDLRGTDSFQDIHPDDREHIQHIFRETIRTGIGQRAEYRFLLKDGSIRYIESQGNVIRDEDGKPFHVVVVSRDITERKEADKKLRLLAYALSCTKDCFCLTDLDNNFLFVNPSFCETYGYCEEELLGKNIEIVRSPSSSSEILQQLRVGTISGRWNGELINCRKDGTEFPVELWTSVVQDEMGQPIALVGVARDITERKHAQAVLAHETGLWHTLMDNIPDTIYFKDKTSRFTRINKAQAQLLGISDPIRAVGKTDFDYFSFDHAQAALADEQTILRTGDSLIGKVEKVLTSNGMIHWFSTTKFPLKDEEGNIIGVVGSSREITELKQVEQHLKENEAKYRLLFESNPEAMWVYDLETLRFLTVNDAAIDRYGYTREEFLSMTIKDIRPVSELPKFQEHIKRKVTGPETFAGFVHQKKNGTLIDVEILAHPIEFSGRQANLIIAKDITERKRAEELQKAVYRIAQAADSAPTVDDLFRMVHEIILTVMPANNFYIALYDEKESLLSFPYFVDEVDVPAPPQKLGRGLTEYVLRTGKSLLCDKALDEDLQRRGEVDLVGVSAPIWLGVPLIVDTKTIGVMTVQHYSDASAYTRREQQVLEFVSSQVAKAIDRKRVEGAVRVSEERYRTVAETASDAIISIDSQSKILFVNSAVEKIFGHSVSELLGKDLAMLMPEYLQYVHKSSLQGYAETGKPHITWSGVELPGLHKKGHKIPLELSFGEFVRDGQHIFTGIVRDITERKRSEELQKAVYGIAQAADSAPTLEDLFRMVHQIIMTVMPATNFYIALYDEKENLLSFPYFVDEVDVPSPPQKLGRGLTEYVLRTGKSLLCDLALDKELLRRGEVELVGVSSPIWLGVPLIVDTKTIGVMTVQHYSDASVYTHREQQVLEFVSSQVAKAIDRKRVEGAVRVSEERYRTLFEESQDSIFLSTPDGKLIDVNKAGVELFGYSSLAELLNIESARNLYFNPDDREIFKSNLSKQGFVRDFEFLIRRKDGQKREVLESASAVRDDKGNIIAYRGFLRDITERKKLEDQLRQAQKMEGIGTLAAGIAHDFNNLLGIILGYTTRLEDRSLEPERVTDSIGIIKKAVQRGADLVRQLLTFARKNDPTFTALNVNETVVELANMLGQTFPKTVAIKLQVSDQLPTIIADATQLQQALLNLCVNARDAIMDTNHEEPGIGNLTLETGTVDAEYLRRKFAQASATQYVYISVKDTGAGMDDATRHRIFEPFFTTKELGKGTGLGLAVVYGVINSHHGYVDVESEHGVGTTFTLYFPVPTEVLANDDRETIRPETSRRGTETILLVEDEEMLAELLKTFLEEQGYSVLTARDGQEGLDIYTQHTHDIALVLSDMGLPRLGGWEMFQKMKERNPDVKAILASGYFDPNLKMDLIKAGAKDFVQKPYVAEIILRRIREVIDGVGV